MRCLVAFLVLSGFASGQEPVSKIKSGRQKYEGVEHQDITVRLYGTTAVTHSRVHMWGVNQSGKFDDRLMMLHVWLNSGGRWQLVGHQTTKLQ